jgi:hypothetical protein
LQCCRDRLVLRVAVGNERVVERHAWLPVRNRFWRKYGGVPERYLPVTFDNVAKAIEAFAALAGPNSLKNGLEQGEGIGLVWRAPRRW